MLGDNQGSLALAKNPEFHSRTKHIEVQYHWIRELVEGGEVNLSYIPTNDMLADALTKGLSRNKHERLMDLLGLDLRSSGSVEEGDAELSGSKERAVHRNGDRASRTVNGGIDG